MTEEMSKEEEEEKERRYTIVIQKCCPPTCSINITKELVKNSECQLQPHTY
jgi:hypothetical protein